MLNADTLNIFCKTKNISEKKRTAVNTDHFSSCKTGAIIIKCN